MKEQIIRPKILIPSGELEKRVVPYIKSVGIEQSRSDKRSLQTYTNRGVTLVQVRPSDIPIVLGLNLPDVIGGIAGSDSFLEQTGELYPGVEIPVYRADERRPRIAIAATQKFIAEQGGNTTLSDLSGRMITTTLPNMTRTAFQEVGIQTVTFPETTEDGGINGVVTIFPVGGKTEALPLLADSCPAVLDVVDSGDTLAANGLEIIKELHEVSVRLVIASGITVENLEIFTSLQELMTKAY